jgi:hypothetical protein
MTKKKAATKKPGRWLYWTPRILSMLFIAFMVLMSFDVFGTGIGFWGTIAAFLIHNIPAFIMIAVLIISWKKEIVGGIAFILFGLAYIALLAIQAIRNGFEWYMLAWSIQIAGVAFLVGILFLINWKKRK